MYTARTPTHSISWIDAHPDLKHFCGYAQAAGNLAKSGVDTAGIGAGYAKDVSTRAAELSLIVILTALIGCP